MDIKKNQKWSCPVGPSDPMAPLFLPTLSPKLEQKNVPVAPPPKPGKKRLWWLLIPAAALAVFAIMYFLKGPVPDTPPVSMETAPDQTQSTVYTEATTETTVETTPETTVETTPETTESVTEAPRVPSRNVLRNPDFNKNYSEFSADTPSLHPDYSRGSIRSITFYSDLDYVPSDAINIAEEGTVLAWVTSSAQSLYDFHIAAEGGVIAPDSCRNLFSAYICLQEIHFNHAFDTSHVTNMYEMFSDCDSLSILDLSDFDTSQVTNMNNMFYYCKNLTTLNLTGMDTSRIEMPGYMFSMFEGCSSLKEENLITNDEKMLQMFKISKNIQIDRKENS